MLRLNSMGQMEEMRDLDVHGRAIAKPVRSVEDHKASTIKNESDLIREIESRETKDKHKAVLKKNELDKKLLAIQNSIRNKRNYEKQVLKDQELFKNYDKLRDDYLEAKYSYQKESVNPKYDKSNHLGWGHLDPSRDYELFEKGLKFGLNESGREVITHGHLSPLNAKQKEEYLTKEEEIQIRQGVPTDIEKRVTETSMEGMGREQLGDFWSDLRDSALKDVQQKADEYLSYDNIKQEAKDLIAEQLNQGGQVQTRPDGSQVMVMPGGQQYAIPMKSSIDTKTLLIAGGALTGVILLAALLRRR